MKLLWWRKSEANVQNARSLAAETQQELEEVHSRWPQVNRVSTEVDEQINLNHFGDLLTYSFQKRPRKV